MIRYYKNQAKVGFLILCIAYTVLGYSDIKDIVTLQIYLLEST